MNDLDQDTREDLEKIEEFKGGTEEIRSKQWNLAKNSSAGVAHKACNGLDYLIAKYDEIMANGSKAPRSKIEYI